MLNRSILVALACALAGPAAAQGLTLSRVFTVLPGISTDKTAAGNPFVPGAGGHTGLLTVELDDDISAVQIGVVNTASTGWGVSRIVVAPSAAYGPDALIGESARDLDGTALAAMLPVQFAHGGVNTPPEVVAGSLLSLPTSAAAAAGQTVLAFASTTAAAAYGGVPPRRGWYVADGLGCIAPQTRVARVTATTVALSQAATGAGCGSGQAIYFSAAPFGPFGIAVPPADPASGAASLTFSDWLPLASLPRIDAGFVPGAAVSGDGIAAGTTLIGTGYHALLLSQGLAAALPARSAVTVSRSAVAARMAAAGSTTIRLADTTGLRVGQTVGGDAAIAPGTHVSGVRAGGITIDRPLAAPLAAGSTIVAMGTVWTSAAAAAGATALPVASTSTRRLLHLRYFTAAGGPPSVEDPGCVPDPLADAVPCEQKLGLAPVWRAQGGEAQGIAIDGIDFVGAIGGAAGEASPVSQVPTFFLRYVGAHAGSTLLACGGYQTAGAIGSVSAQASYARITAALATSRRPSVPVTVVDTASAGLSTATDFANCSAWLTAIVPAVMVQQDYSNHNGQSVSEYMALVEQEANAALAQGTQPIIYLGYAEGSTPIGTLPVDGPVRDSTTVPLLFGINSNIATDGVLVTGAGVPPGTTATLTNGAWSLELSQPVTLPAHTILQLGFEEAGVGGDGTALEFTTPSFETNNLATAVTGDGIPAADAKRGSLVLTKNSTTGILSAPAETSPGAVLTVSVPIVPNDNYVAAAAAYRAITGEPWAAVQWDGLATIGTDPATANALAPGFGTQGSYANDDGNLTMARAFEPVLGALLEGAR